MRCITEAGAVCEAWDFIFLGTEYSYKLIANAQLLDNLPSIRATRPL